MTRRSFVWRPCFAQASIHLKPLALLMHQAEIRLSGRAYIERQGAHQKAGLRLRSRVWIERSTSQTCCVSCAAASAGLGR